MSTLERRGLHGQLVDELGYRIMRGHLVSGTILDPEQFEREFGVSRTVVREALKVLTAKGLVGARPRFGTFVTERAQWKLLDADVMGWRASDDPDPRLVRELDEVRLAIEPAAARMAAERRTPEQLKALHQAWAALSESYRSNEPNRPDHAEADFAFHRGVLTAAGNELLERFEVLLGPALHARDRLAHEHVTSFDFLELHRLVLAAIDEADPDEAELRMENLMRRSLVDSTAALSRREQPEAKAN